MDIVKNYQQKVQIICEHALKILKNSEGTYTRFGKKFRTSELRKAYDNKDCERVAGDILVNKQYKTSKVRLADLKTKYNYMFGWMTYAVVDDSGWQEPDSKNFIDEFILNRDPETTLILVDCCI